MDGEQELVEALECFSHLLRVSQEVVDIDVSDVASSQVLLQQYASTLAYLPKSLQLVHDFSRFTKSLYASAESVLETLSSSRGVSGEEERVLYSLVVADSTVKEVVSLLESVLLHVRSSTQSLLELIVFDDEGFASFASSRLSSVGASRVLQDVFSAQQILSSLLHDLREFSSLQEHAQSL
ncbi:MAG: hypothetical protein ACMXYD_04325 [Candidatus Woesearchaeota archaeon]